MNMSNKEIFMLYPKISENKTGIVVSMLRRAELLANYGYKIKILTIEHDLNTRANFEKLYSDCLLKNTKNIELINLFSYYQKKSSDYFCSIAACVENGVEFDSINNRIYKDTSGRTKRYEVFKSSKLIHINFFENGQVVSRSRYDDYGKLCSNQILNEKKVIAESFFDVNGKLVIQVHYGYNKDKRVIQNLHLFDEHGMVIQSCQSLIELAQYTIQRKLCIDPRKKYLFLIDRINVFNLLLKDNIPSNFFMFGTIHAAHYNNPNDIKSSPNKNYTPYFRHIDKLSGLIILTHRQKKDIEELYGAHNNYKVIPHALAHRPDDYYLTFDPYKFVSLARYDKVKRLDLLISIFERVVTHHPQATLDLFGFGLEYSNLKKMIKDKKLENHIFLKPFVSDVNQVLQEASMLLLTSQSESFCLVIMEALANGCPVTSFDIRYGPSEMIQHNQNGYLIADGDVEQYAQKIIQYLNDQQNMSHIREQAKLLSQNFSSTSILKKWVELFESI
ncbi:glycosyltransferase [Acinetobacter wanghuae]|uniref:Glycosyltransferase n=1 Tax=Acinetobacter wanghuae TaxID=2662362 RepID=A0A5Q0P3L2_9GAMM|nr:glycosyltransferase [Acinetobacter wanghuae]MQW91370.1 glycosyltransferase [Acinetobacter wanghuae]QGA11725.1 glycosyltransferase [Acinetobacter wanghuae]